MQDFSSRKVDLMQPLSSLFTNGIAANPNNANNKNGSANESQTTANNMQARSGKSRNVSDQCYNQRDQVIFEYNSTAQGRMLYKTSAPMGASRNAKQHFATLGSSSREN